jgi:hypothetical protein
VRSSRALIVAVAALLALALTGCGKEHHQQNPVAETEGINLEVGHLLYQVQLSRQLNPFDTEDRTYLEGVPPEQARLQPDQVWFGIFVRVQNETDKPHMTAEDFEIVDTQENVYRPVEIRGPNPFAYHARELAPRGLLPSTNSEASYAPTSVALVLFKLSLTSLSNRPLELKIHSPAGVRPRGEGTVDLDV